MSSTYVNALWPYVIFNIEKKLQVASLLTNLKNKAKICLQCLLKYPVIYVKFSWVFIYLEH